MDILAALKEVHRQELLPAYDEQAVSAAIADLHRLVARIESTVAELDDEQVDDPQYACALYATHETIHRRKRVLLAYLMARIRKLEQQRFIHGPRAHSAALDGAFPSEMGHVQRVNAILDDYVRSLKVPISLTERTPPSSLFIEVRVVREVGDIVTENGIVTLRKHTTHFVRRSDVEGFIQSGHLVVVS